MKGAADVFGQAFDLVNLGRPLGDGAEHRAVVDLLEGFAVAVGTRDLADKHNHRRAVLFRDMDARAGICGARPACDEQHAGLARHLAMRLGHHRGPALLSTDDILDIAVIEPVQRCQKAFARHREDPRYSLDTELIDQDFAAVPHVFPLSNFSQTAPTGRGLQAL